MSSRDVIRIAIGIVGLGLGTLIYLLDRPPAFVYFIPDRNPYFTGYMTTFGQLGNNLPTFLHPFSFSLITAGVLACRSTGLAALISLGWFTVNCTFELGQVNTTSQWLIEYIPQWFDKIVVLENTANYLQSGTYDPRDVLSIAFGSLTAFLINLHLKQEGRTDVSIICH